MGKIEEFLNTLNKTAETTVEETTVEETTTTTIDKTAEEQAAEAYFEKLANQNETIEAAAALSMIGDHLCKIAEADESGLLGECGNGLIEASASLSLGLQKIASEDMEGMIVDAVETQYSLYKIATVLSEVATQLEDEDFTKMASVVVDVNNTMFDELNDLAANDESVRNYLIERHGLDKEAGVKDVLGKAKKAFMAPLDSAKARQSVEAAAGEKMNLMKAYMKNVKDNPKAHIKELVPHAAVLAALTAAGYGAKKAAE